MSNDLSILHNILKSCGLTDTQATQLCFTYHIRNEGAVIDAVLDKLSTSERSSLELKLQAGPKTSQYISESLAEACKSSTNSLNIDNITTKARLNTSNKFWQELLDVLNTKQKAQLEKAMDKTISDRPELKQNISQILKTA